MNDLLPDDAALASSAAAFAIAARRIATMVDLSTGAFHAILPLGLNAVASGLVSGPRAASENPFHFANWSAEWIAHYRAENYLLIDPVPRWARNSGVALTWSELVERLPARDVGRGLIESGARFGYTEGMIVPMRAGDNSLGLVCMAGRRGPLRLAEQIHLTTIGRAIFEAAERIDKEGDIGRAAPIMSLREIECLVLLVRGHTDKQIGAMLGLSEPTVRFHLGNARDKCGAVSRTHLAALAVARGYVNL